MGDDHAKEHMRLLFAGGGTAGHINPALAVAGRIMQDHPGSEIRFVGTPAGMENRLVPRAGYSLYTIEMRGLSRSFSLAGLRDNARAVRLALAAVKRAGDILSEFRPDAVVGTGGYASFPAVYAAAKRKIPTAILEVNALPGVATKLLASRVNRVLVGYEETARRLKKAENIRVTGSPIREELRLADREKARRELGVPEGKPLVVSFWGSLGAYRMNQCMAGFVGTLAKTHAFHHIHATGQSGWKWMPDYFREQGVEPADCPDTELREYIYDMDRVMAAADLVLCRAGASTLAELQVVGRASVLVPSPYVAENHQELNARALESAGAAVVALEKECTGESLYKTVEGLVLDTARLREMEKNARKLGSPFATRTIAEEIAGLV